MKFKLALLTAIISTASVVAASAATSPDYNKIRKDLNVMSQVIKGAFEDNEDCTGCQVKITTNYLAEQGAVFTIGTYRNSHSFSYSSSDDHAFVIKESTLQSKK